ncbi:MAG: hypothetical protein H7199_00840 [Burkholderiales bacterium]|nr:hypothetical protein [Flavobacterium sp.]
MLIPHLVSGNVDKKRGSYTSNIVIIVTNLFKNDVKYKYILDYDYQEFYEWIWISCNNNTFIIG